MSNDNLTQLAKLAKLINTDKIITPEEIQQVIAALVAVLANNKKSTESLNAETKTTVQQALAFVNEQLTKLRQENADLRTQIESDTGSKVTEALKQAQAFITEAKAAMPKDGKDADPAAVVPLVMQQIKLPENKQYILTGQDVLDSLNNLPADDEEYKIDASRIKNLPRLKGQVLHGGFRNLQVFSGSTLLTKFVRFLHFTGAGVTATAGTDPDTITVTIPGGSGTAADEDATDSGDHTTFTISHTPIANTLLVINENTGQAVPTSAYTNTTTSITFNQAQSVDDGTGNLVTPTFRARYFY